LWHELGNDDSVHHSEYPKFEAKFIKEDSKEYPISVNGKKRDAIQIPSDATKEEIEKIALASENVQKWIEGKQVRKVIVVPGRMVNIVV